jgi:preprotein translocase subunit YajC
MSTLKELFFTFFVLLVSAAFVWFIFILTQPKKSNEHMTNVPQMATTQNKECSQKAINEAAMTWTFGKPWTV